MIDITQYNTICQQLVDDIPGLDGFVRVVDDNQATRKLGSKKGIHMVAVTPSASGAGLSGREVDNNVAYFFILEKPKSSPTEAQELDQYQRTQDVTHLIRDYIQTRRGNGCSVFFRQDPTTVTIDPEFNTFGGWNGWSLSFIF